MGLRVLGGAGCSYRVLLSSLVDGVQVVCSFVVGFESGKGEVDPMKSSLGEGKVILIDGLFISR
jgi:hypothetical protein